MFKQALVTIVLVIFIVFISGCGPSEEEIQAMTEAAWTSTPTLTLTPTSTPTPTPVPYSLSVQIINEDGSAISGALVVLSEFEEEEGKQQTDDQGSVTWFDLPGENVTLHAEAQGYLPSDTTEIIPRGSNQITMTLARDPYGILPSEACAPGETLLYIEDFQDGHAQGWNDIELRANGWDILSSPAEVDNLVASRPSEYAGSAGYGDQIFSDIVWRIKVMPMENLPYNFNLYWSSDYDFEGEKVEWSWYSLMISPPQQIWVFRIQEPISSITLRDTQRNISKGAWHNFEFSIFQGRFEIWIDGKQLLAYDDPQPLPEGYFLIGAGFGDPMEPEAPIYYDNIVACQLSTPFVPMPTPESAP